MTDLIEEAEAMAVDALERCIDWNGAAMVDGEQPRRIPTCGDLRDQAALIRRLADYIKRQDAEYVAVERGGRIGKV